MCQKKNTLLANSRAKVTKNIEIVNEIAEKFLPRLSFYHKCNKSQVEKREQVSLFRPYFSGISVSNCFMRFQKGATQLIWQRSFWVCGLSRVGPNETTSR